MQAVYRGRVRLGYTKDGKPIDKYVSGHTKEELENVKQACREHYIEGRPIPKEQLFYEYAEDWYTVRKEPFISASSRSAYKSCFMKHILFIFIVIKYSMTCDGFNTSYTCCDTLL